MPHVKPETEPLCNPTTTGTTWTASYTSKIGFPHKTTVGMWWWKRELPNMWDDLGEDKYEKVHKFCGQQLCIGREDGKLFKFCPRCEVKVE